MSCQSGNLFAGLGDASQLKCGDEIHTPLLDVEKLRVVRICSAASDDSKVQQTSVLLKKF